jgi:hypothetical protein
MCNVTLSDAARRSAQDIGLTEPDVKRARRAYFREHEEPAFVVYFAEVENGRTLRMRCCHHDPGQIVSLGWA